MKIGILSMQRVFNYGSFLQAYGLKHILESMGHEVFFLDIACSNKTGTFEYTKSNINSKERYARLINKCDRYIWKRLKYKIKNKQLDDMFMKVQKDCLKLPNDPLYNEKCDAVIIGSDEVFNCMQKGSWENSYQLFGQDLPAPIVVTYAASCGFTKLEDIDIKIRKNIQNAFTNISMFSVRDMNTFNFVLELTNIEPIIHLDPVLIYDFKKEVKHAMQEVKRNDKFILVYAYRNRISKKEEINAIRKYAKEKGLKTIAIGGSQPWCDEFAILTPFQVLAYFKLASCIVTDTFHGTVVAAKYNKPFATIIRDSNKNKLNDLIQRLHLEKHLVYNIKDIGNVLTEDDYNDFNEIMNIEKKRTLEYLKQINENRKS
ncbi:MAG: polysaccharide pyruvyl transferase family protein [Mobilitalea sp.]